MGTILFTARSRGKVSIKSSDPTGNHIVNHRYPKSLLNAVIESAVYRKASKIATRSTGTKNIMIRSWPWSGITTCLLLEKSEWFLLSDPIQIDTCKTPLSGNHPNLFSHPSSHLIRTHTFPTKRLKTPIHS